LDAGQTINRADRRGRTDALLLEAHGACDLRRRAELLDAVVALNSCVAVAIADRYRGRCVAVDDLHRSALEGLIKAVHRYDPTVGPDLLTYAVPTIRGAVQRCLGDQSWMVRPSRPLQDMQWTVNSGIEHMEPEIRGVPTEDEMRDREANLAEDLEALPRPSMAG
jgi:RNA polymerase sigma-B factor